MLSNEQKKFYSDEGYLLLEDVISSTQLKKILEITNDLIEKSRPIKESNHIYDLEKGHYENYPRLTRIIQPHQVDKYFWDLIKNLKSKKY